MRFKKTKPGLAAGHVKPFFFKNKSAQEVVDFLNENYPVSLTNRNNDLIDRIAARYPIISREQVKIIVEKFFTVCREKLILGHNLNIKKIFHDTSLFFYTRELNNKVSACLRVRMKTPKFLKIIPK